MPSNNNKDDLIGVTIRDRYRIISKLGAGGMGTAYRAWDEQVGVPVVIKIPKKLFLEDPKFAERFFREIRLLQGLNHPHIVPIEGVGAHEGGLPFVVLRFLPGGSLSNRRLRDEHGKPRPGPPGMVHLWLPAVAEALDFVHSQGVVHRDVKPANIFFDAFWGAFLGDFGIAKIVEESETFDREHTLTATHMGIGTPEYMAPEQFAPKAVIQGRADQYALAVIAYEMLAGSRPFTGATAHLIVEVTTQQVPPLQAARRDLPASLVNAVHRGLAKRPDERFTTCRDFATAVLQDVPLLTDEPDVARLLCPKCSNILKLPLEAAGKRGKCPRCQTTMEVAHDLGALWLLDEARRQRKLAVSTDTSETEPLAGVIWAIDQTEEEALEAFKPVSSTTPIERAARRQKQKVPPVAIWGGLAVVLLAAVVNWNLLLGSNPKKTPLTYEEKLTKANAVLESDPLDHAANELLGRHWCFKEQDWSKGLPYLSKSNTIFASAATKELDANKVDPTNPGELIRTARFWWAIVSNPTLNTAESTKAIKKHAAAIYIAAVDGVRVGKDVADVNGWLDHDSEFRTLVANRRPPKERLKSAEEVLAQSLVVNSIGMRLTLVPAGAFIMGSDTGQADERPAHNVRITRPFYLSSTEVTNAQWKAVMGSLPSKWKDDARPVEQVSWDDAVAFCNTLSARLDEKVAGREYRLPTEAEWEFACRAGSSTRYSFGDSAAALDEYAWFKANSNGQTQPVGQKKPNAWGLYDMHGNVWEWCSDAYAPYPSGTIEDPIGPGSKGLYRGGCWKYPPSHCRSVLRVSFPRSSRFDDAGFRVVMTAREPKADAEAESILGNQANVFLADLTVTAKKAHFFHNKIPWEPVGGIRYPNTIHIHPELGSGQSQLVFAIDGKYDEIVGAIGVLDLAKRIASPQVFRVIGDGRELWRSVPLKQTGRGEDFRVNISGVKTLELRADSTGPRFDAHCVWIEPQLVRRQSGGELNPGPAAPDPGTLSQHRASVGQTLSFKVVGSATSGPVWGSNPYTADSRLSRAAVHAGVLRPGESGVIRVTVLPGQQAYEGSTQNGVTSSRYGPWSLSYRIEKKPSGGLSEERAAPPATEGTGDRPPPSEPSGGKAPAAEPAVILALPPLKNAIGVTLKLIPAGSFQMGADDGAPNETPNHEVRITKPFYLGVTEVTNAQWKAVMGGEPPSRWKDDNRPVEQVSWDDVVKFCDKLSALPAEKAAGRVYRLPTEAEWEYACRAGTTTAYSYGDNPNKLNAFGWFRATSSRETHAVASKKPNPWGLYDMHGNAWEWCSDGYSNYEKVPVMDPLVPARPECVVRGGGFWELRGGCRSTVRLSRPQTSRQDNLGFRLALSASGASPPEAGGK
jgi:formylglycine-generating enzyme required for sulfatase activity/serine/threonine protein kinase